MSDKEWPKVTASEERNEAFAGIRGLIINAIRSNGGDYKSATVDVYSLAEVLLEDYGDGEVKDWLRSLRDAVVKT